MSSFIASAGKRITDVRSYIRDAAGGSSIKYVAAKGEKHQIYIPFECNETVDESGKTNIVKRPIAISGEVHDWDTADGKFKSVVCMKGIVIPGENGVMVNDGSCPFCDRVSDGWDIYNYRKEAEEATCTLTGAERDKYMEKTLSSYANQRKAKAARSHMYMLVVKFRLNSDGSPIIGTDNLPEYDLKVMKMPSTRVEKLEQQLMNSGCDLPGSEIIFEYPNIDDRRLLISQSTTAPLFENMKITVKYPAVLEKINQDVAKFDFEGIDKSFPEWAGMTTLEAKHLTDAMFEKWDEYRQELTTNSNAKYMEYISSTPVTHPALGGLGAPSIPGVAVPSAAVPGAAPIIPSVAQPVPGMAVPGAAVPGAAPVIPNAAPTVDPNSVFGAAAGNISI